MNPKKIVFLFSFLIVVSNIADIHQLLSDRDQHILNTAEIKTSIQTKYPGKIEKIKLSKTTGNEIYMVDLQDQNRGYALKVDAYSGEILRLTQLKKDTSQNPADIEYGDSVSFLSGEKGDEKLVKCKEGEPRKL